VVGHEIGWEERVNCALVQALRTGLAKPGKESLAGSAPPKPKMAADTKKLKKHMTLVCDRLSKGMSLLGNSGAGCVKKTKTKTKRGVVDTDMSATDDPVERTDIMGGGGGGGVENCEEKSSSAQGQGRRSSTGNTEEPTEAKVETPV
jgi:hypothetical protein